MVKLVATGKPLFDFRASLRDSVDFSGVPSVSDGYTVWNPPLALLPRVDRDGENGIFFADELSNAPISVQNVLLQLFIDGKIGSYVFPASWRMIAAGNRQSDKAGANRMSTALLDRFARIELEPDVKSWSTWANINGIDPRVVAFVNFRPAILHNTENAECVTPRGWARVSKVISANAAIDPYHVARMNVGEAAAIEFNGFLRVYATLPKLADVIAFPDTCDVPQEISGMYAMATALSRNATQTTFEDIRRYLKRMSPEFATLAIIDAVKRDSELKNTKAFVTWAIENQDIIL
jgi:hypothetical protein